MLGIDPSDGDEKRHEHPEENGDLRRKQPPDEDEQRGGDDLDGDVTERDRRATMPAFSPQAEPTHNGQVLPKRELVLTDRAERAARLVHRHAQR